MTELHLFAGAGGGILGGLLLEHTPVCAVEVEPFCQEVLRARQRDGLLPTFPIYGDIRSFDGRPWAGRVDVVAGGFPCQDISVAGKGAGITGERSGLWAEMARVIGEVRPRYAFVENSPALVGRGLTRVLGDLAALGYDAWWRVLGAHHTRAPHKRDRLWILAVANGERRQPGDGGRVVPDSQRDGAGQIRATQFAEGAGGAGALADAAGVACGQGWPGRPAIGAQGDAGCQEALCGQLADADGQRRNGRAGVLGTGWRAESTDCGGLPLSTPSGAGLAEREGAQEKRAFPAVTGGHRRPVEPRLGRSIDGVARWMDRSQRGFWRGDRWERGIPRLTRGGANRPARIRAIGNGQVPQVAALAWRALMAEVAP